MGDQFVIAALTDERAKGTATVASLRPELSALVRNEEKAKQIMAKLPKTGTLEEMASKYGPTAQVGTANDVVLGQGSLDQRGLRAPGRGQSLRAEARPAFGRHSGRAGRAGGGAGELDAAPRHRRPESRAASQLAQQRAQQQDGKIYEAIKAHANVKDNRAKFF